MYAQRRKKFGDRLWERLQDGVILEKGVFFENGEACPADRISFSENVMHGVEKEGALNTCLEKGRSGSRVFLLVYITFNF